MNQQKYYLQSTNQSIMKLAEEVSIRNPTVAKHELSLFDVNDSLCKITEREISKYARTVLYFIIASL